MPNRTFRHRHEQVLDALRSHSQGIGIAQLETELQDPPSRRTLRRWLDQLVDEGRVQRDGKTRGVTYRLSPSTDSSPGDKGAIIPYSDGGLVVHQYARLTIEERRPVGYRRDLLDSYRPNETYYLSQNLRSHLHRIGRTPAAERAAGTYARQILDRLLIDLSWASSRLEGNTYSRLDTERLLLEGRGAEGKDALETQMILNHKAAIEFLVSGGDELGFNRYTFFNLHSLLVENLLRNPNAAGRIRQIQVGISSSVFQPLAVPAAIEECFDQLLSSANAIQDPFEQSFFLLVHLPYLQPFEDGNKRTSRLAANLPLVTENLCPLSFLDVPTDEYVEAILGVYELNKVGRLIDVFVWAYERSCHQYLAVQQSMPEPDAFRLRYRSELIDAVRRIVLEKAEPRALAGAIAKTLPSEDRAKFQVSVLEDLSRVHEGTLARYRLRPSEYEEWRSEQSEGC